MGLSDEERLLKFYNGMAGWRRALVKLESAVEKDFQDIVKGWVREVDTIVGIQIERADTNGLYWIVGPNEGGFQSLWKETYDLGRKGSFEREEPKELSLAWWQDKLDLEEVAKRWTQGKFTENRRVIALACWWTAWNWIPALLYPVNRYEDDLFTKDVKDRFIRLIGEMANLRLDVARRWAADDLGPLYDYEQALLCRYELLHTMLRAEDTKRWEGAYGEEEKRLAAWKATREDDFDGQKLVEDVGSMPLAEVKQRLETARREDWERRHKSDPTEEKRRKEKTDGVLGPSPRSLEELESILEKGTDYEEAKKAAEEREAVYRIFGGGWEARFEKPKAEAKKKRVKTRKPFSKKVTIE